MRWGLELTSSTTSFDLRLDVNMDGVIIKCINGCSFRAFNLLRRRKGVISRV